MFFRRFLVLPLIASLALIAAPPAQAKPVYVGEAEISLPDITPDGEIDLTPGSGTAIVGTVKVKMKRGRYVVSFIGRGIVANLSGEKFKSTSFDDYLEGEDEFPAGLEAVKYSYTVSKTGRALLKLTYTGEVFDVP